MTVRLRDLFSGGDTADIAGRNPDGGGDPTLALGTYVRAYAAEADDVLGITGGVLVCPAGSQNDLLYAIVGTGLTNPDYTVRTKPTFALPADGFAYAYAGVRVDAQGNGYWAQLAKFLGFGWELSLYRVLDDGATWQQLQHISIPTELPAGETVLEINAVGTFIRATVVGTGLGVRMFDTTYSGAEGPGIGGTSGDGVLELSWSALEVDDASAPGLGGPPYHTAALARDGFSGPDAGNIAGRTPDGGGTPALAVGSWLQHPTQGSAPIEIRGGKAVISAGYADYPLSAIPGLPATYRSELTLRFPTTPGEGPYDPGTPGFWELIWEDEFDGAAGTALAGRVHNGGSAGTGTWTRVDSGDASGPGATLDGSGRVYNPSAIGPSPGFAGYAPIGLTLPAGGKLRIEVDAYNDGSQVGTDNRGFFGVLQRWQNGAPVTNAHPLYTEAYWWDAQFSDDPASSIGLYNFYHAATGSVVGGLGGPLAGGQHVDAGETATFITDIQGQGAAPAVINVRAEAVAAFTYYDGQFTARSNFDNGPPGLLMPASYFGNPARIARFAIYSWNPGTPATGGGAEFAYGEVAVSHDPVLGNAYQLGVRFQHFGAFIDVVLWLYIVDADAYTQLRSAHFLLGHDTDLRFSLERRANVLYSFLADAELLDFRFDLDTDLAEETGATVTVHTGGLPDMDLDDDSDGEAIAGLLFSVYGPPTGVPCLGPPENPYPQGYPPLEPLPSLLYRMGRTNWDQIEVPGPAGPGGIAPTAGGAHPPLTAAYIRTMGGWELLEGGLEQVPPPTTDVPIYHDPCVTLDPGTDLPPNVDVDPVPYSGPLVFGLGPMAPTLIGALFNGCQRDATVPYLMTDLAQAAARGGHVLAAQGGYKKFVTLSYGGRLWYSQAAMDAFIMSHAPYASEILAYQAATTFWFQHIADDFRVQPLWPTSTATGGGSGRGLDDDELDRICGVWQIAVPGIRLGIRARPRTFSRPIRGVTVYTAQFDGPQQVGKVARRDTLTVADFRSWRNAEIAKVVSFNNGSVLNMPPNWIHGGCGEAGSTQIFTGTMFDGRWTFSAGEVLRAAEGWFGDGGGGYGNRIIGSVGYMYHTILMGLPGMVDAMAAHRNALFALPGH